MKTDLNYIKKLIKLLESGNINEIEIEEEGTRLKVVKSKPSENSSPQIISYSPQPQVIQSPVSIPPPEQTTAVHKAEPKAETPVSPAGKELIEVRSPIVGTFYRAPSPNAEPYVQVGQQVSKGTILCIVEAMKLMNEIECEYDGKIVKIMVENAQPVEYNQVLFLIEPL
ncbi:MAG: acetyl-CoA carboxylase biotin carboxyl carrier protein [Chlorobi bacterium]|nr:acetyl-CoA carboxylase biotin carboxyl carrier protein [Chlorobiota bacterium]MCI0715603.1 acetyl-CoA carboxylase biotin carboxyl carrier protein [Chlorobiota bacterium]